MAANLEKYKDAARKHELKEQWPKAIELLVKAIEEFEKSPDNDADLALYNRVGDLFVKVNDTTNAIQYYERAVDKYFDAGLVNPAIAVCNKVLRLSPGRAASYLKLGMLFAKKGFAAEAKQNLSSSTPTGCRRRADRGGVQGVEEVRRDDAGPAGRDLGGPVAAGARAGQDARGQGAGREAALGVRGERQGRDAAEEPDEPQHGHRRGYPGGAPRPRKAS